MSNLLFKYSLSVHIILYSCGDIRMLTVFLYDVLVRSSCPALFSKLLYLPLLWHFDISVSGFVIGRGSRNISLCPAKVSVGEELGSDQGPNVEYDGDPLASCLDPHCRCALLGRLQTEIALYIHRRIEHEDGTEDARIS